MSCELGSYLRCWYLWLRLYRCLLCRKSFPVASRRIHSTDDNEDQTDIHTCALRSSCPDKIDGSSNLMENMDGTSFCIVGAPELVPTPSNSTSTMDSAKAVEAALACDIGFIRNGSGSCVLQPSAAARARRAIPYRHQHKAMCANSSEIACPVRGGGFECLNVGISRSNNSQNISLISLQSFAQLTQSLESCGGCPGQGGVTCADIPGVMDVVCRQSKCVTCESSLRTVCQSGLFSESTPSLSFMLPRLELRQRNLRSSLKIFSIFELYPFVPCT